MVSGLFNYRWSVTLLIPDLLGSTYAVYTLGKLQSKLGEQNQLVWPQSHIVASYELWTG